MSETLSDVSGGCHCGAVRYRATDVAPQVTECHCSQCRKQSGHRYAVVDAKTSALGIESADNLTWYRASAAGERGFCSVCGSTLFWKSSEEDFTALLAASVDTPNGLVMAQHIYAADKGAYYEIDDGLPQHDADA